MSLNPKIKKVVHFLNLYNFRTTDSGDGETHDYECDRDYTYVSIIVEPEKLIQQTHVLKGLLEARGIRFGQVGTKTPCIQASYDPVNKMAIIDLMNVNDEMII